MAAKKHRFLLFLFICLGLILIVLVAQNYRTINTIISDFDFSTLYLRFPAMQQSNTRIYPAGENNYLFYTNSNLLGMAGIKNKAAWNMHWTTVPDNIIIQDAVFVNNMIIVDGKKISDPGNTEFFLHFNIKGIETGRFAKRTVIPHITMRLLPAADRKIIVTGYAYPGTYESGLYTGLYTQEGKALKEQVLPATANLVLGKGLQTSKGECILVCLEKRLFPPASLVKVIKFNQELTVLFNQNAILELDTIVSVTEKKENTIVITGTKKTWTRYKTVIFSFAFPG